MTRSPGEALSLLEATIAAQRAILRARRPEDVVTALERLVHTLGGSLVPGHVGGQDVLQLDIGLGVRDPSLPWAPPDDPARDHLQQVLPGVLEDARRIVHLLWVRDDHGDTTLRDELTGALHLDATARLIERGAPDDSLVGFAVGDSAAVAATHGRSRADVLLRQLTGFVRSELDVDERLGRLTGPAVVVVLRGHDPSRAQELIERVSARWGRQRTVAAALTTAVVVRGDDPVAVRGELAGRLGTVDPTR